MTDLPLYPSEDEIARAVLGPGRAKDWPGIAAHDERHGLPPVDPVHGGRPWPLVERFYRAIMGLDRPDAAGGPLARHRVRIVDTAEHREENPSAEKDAALRARRPQRRAFRARP